MIQLQRGCCDDDEDDDDDVLGSFNNSRALRSTLRNNNNKKATKEPTVRELNLPTAHGQPREQKQAGSKQAEDPEPRRPGRGG